MGVDYEETINSNFLNSSSIIYSTGLIGVNFITAPSLDSLISIEYCYDVFIDHIIEKSTKKTNGELNFCKSCGAPKIDDEICKYCS